MLNTMQRPLLRYHGGKWNLAPWIISQMPRHRIYVEAFGGGGNVLLRKPRAYAEVYNDLDGEIVNLFKVARDHGHDLQAALKLTPFARQEFLESYEPSTDPIEQARRTVIRAYMGFGSNSLRQVSGFRANSNRSGTTPAHDWANYPDALPMTIDRLQGVVIENRPAQAVCEHHDGPKTLHYLDPPYPFSTRSGCQGYNHEMTDEQHCEFAEWAHRLKGVVLVSGYQCELYDELFGDWRRLDRASHADGARDRTESLWINRRAIGSLFE